MAIKVLIFWRALMPWFNDFWNYKIIGAQCVCTSQPVSALKLARDMQSDWCTALSYDKRNPWTEPRFTGFVIPPHAACLVRKTFIFVTCTKNACLVREKRYDNEDGDGTISLVMSCKAVHCSASHEIWSCHVQWFKVNCSVPFIRSGPPQIHEGIIGRFGTQVKRTIMLATLKWPS